MRKIDKLKQIEKANVLAEQRYLKSKGFISESSDKESNSLVRGGKIIKEGIRHMTYSDYEIEGGMCWNAKTYTMGKVNTTKECLPDEMPTLIVNIDFDATPEEPASFDTPGSTGEIQIRDVELVSMVDDQGNEMPIDQRYLDLAKQLGFFDSSSLEQDIWDYVQDSRRESWY